MPHEGSGRPIPIYEKCQNQTIEIVKEIILYNFISWTTGICYFTTFYATIGALEKKALTMRLLREFSRFPLMKKFPLLGRFRWLGKATLRGLLTLGYLLRHHSFVESHSISLAPSESVSH